MIGDRWATFVEDTSWWCSLCWTWHRDECTHPLGKPR